MKKRIIIISIFIIAIIGIIVGVVIHNKKPNLEYQLEIVKEINYMVYSENNKFGVISRNGEVLIQANYDEIQIPNPEKPVFICKYNYNPESNQYNIKVLNEKSEQILYQYVTVEAIKLNTDISNIPYEKSVLKYQEKGKYGLIDFQGNVILKAKYEEISSFDYNEGLLLTKQNGKYGIVNINGVVVVKPEFDLIESDAYYEEGVEYRKSAYIVANKDGNSYKYGLLRHNGEKVLDIKYEQVARIENKSKDDNIYAVTFENGKAGFYKNGENVIPNVYEDISYDSNNNCLIVQKDEKQGILDFQGEELIKIQYDNIYISGQYINAQDKENIDIYNFSNMQTISIDGIVGLNDTPSSKYAIAITNDERYEIYLKEENKIQNTKYDYLEYLYDDCFIAATSQNYSIINSNGKKLLNRKYNSIQKLPNSNIVQASYNNNKKIDLIANNDVILTFTNADIVLESDYISVISPTELKYVSYDGRVIDNYDIIERQLYSYSEKEKWGFRKKDGTIVIEAKYDFVTEFNQYGFAGIKLGEKWGSINIDGSVVIEPTYVIDSNSPSFVGKFYEYNTGYSEPYYVEQDL